MLRFLTILLTLLLYVTPVSAEELLVLGGTEHEVTAVSMEILEAAYAKMGIIAKGRMYPSKRSLVEAANGQIDGEINRVRDTELEYPTLIRVPVPINSFESIVYSCNTTYPIDGWDSIAHLRIGIMRGIRYAEHATRDMARVTIEGSYDKLFDLLKMGRIDVVISSRPEGFWQRQRPGGECVRDNEPPIVQKEIYHFLHEKHADLVPRLTTILESMRASGEMAAIKEQATADYRSRQH